MKEGNEREYSRLFQHLLWAQTTEPRRFTSVYEFQQWAESMGYDSSDCKQVWSDLESVYQQQFGEPMVQEEMNNA
jgi:hypothetical protein